MTFDLIRRVESFGKPRILVVGDIILDRYIYGDVSRISQEAPVAILKAARREHRLGGAASVAAMLATLGADVWLMGVAGQTCEDWATAHELLIDLGIYAYVYEEPDRPTTVKERYMGGATDRHPQQMLRVDYETDDPISEEAEVWFVSHLVNQFANEGGFDVVLVSDYGKGVCADFLMDQIRRLCKEDSVPLIVDPYRYADHDKYCGASCITPNRHELAEAMACNTNDLGSIENAALLLARENNIRRVMVTVDKDGIILASDPWMAHYPTRPRQVYDVTGAGDMVLAMVGMAVASGASYEEAACLANVAGGLEVERLGTALITKEEIIADLLAHDVQRSKVFTQDEIVVEAKRRRALGQTIVFTNGCFDLLHVGHARLLKAAKAEGDFLIVAVNSDESVRRLKGETRPLQPATERVEMLTGFSDVDAVVEFGEDTPYMLIARIGPDVLVKGGDYTPEYVVGNECAGRVVIVPFVEGKSTSRLVELAEA